MRILIFGGSGKIGSAVAWDLVRDDEVKLVGIVGRHKDTLEKTKRWINSSKVLLHILDIADRKDLKGLMEKYDVGIITLPNRKASYKVIETAIEAGLDIVDVLEEYHRRPDPYETEGLEISDGMDLNDYGEWLHKKALSAGVTFIDGIGFAPGLSNITLGEGIRKMDRAEEAIARVGGIPTNEAARRHPLRYMITWAFEHVLREYMVKLKVIKNKKAEVVGAMSDYERFKFTKFGKNEELECFVTPGMPSFLFTREGLHKFAEKTIRWPGHWQAIQVLKECGLLNLKPIEFKGGKITPREIFLSIIEPKLRPVEGDKDVCVMFNTVTGLKEGQKTKIDYYMWDEADTKNGISSMARVTGFPAAIAAKFLAKGKIKAKGIVAPEDCIKGSLYKEFMEELEKRDIVILEVSRS